uniref:Interleukin 22 n=1 Tax=Neogobius melanostomus TaxID=47308 RepID=A0A8C6U5L9_9GOBI
MQGLSSCLKSFLRPAASVLLPLLLIGWIGHTVTTPVHRSLSRPLRNPETYNAVNKVSQHAQDKSIDDTRIILQNYLNQNPKFALDHLKICCLHANILDFYLHNILPRHDNKHRTMNRVRNDLQRISEDLETHGCVSIFIRLHLAPMGEEQGINKAVGEINILFSCLQDFCVQTKNQTAAQ